MTNKLIQTQLLDEMNVLMFLIDTDLTITYANKSFLDFSNITLETIKGIPAWELPLWQNNADLQNSMMFTLGHVFSSEEATRMEVITVNHLGQQIELDLQIKPIVEDGIVINIMVVGYNITELVHAKKFLTKRERQIGAFFEYSTQGYFFQMLSVEALIPEVITEEFVNQVYEAQKVESINPQVFDYIGLDVSLEDRENYDIISSLGLGDQKRIDIWIEMINEGISTRRVEIVNKKTKNKVFLELKFVAIKANENTFEGNFCIVSNITKDYVYEKELNFLANKDPLTGLNNRRNFKGLAIEILKDKKEDFSAVMLDIDKFKNINDTYGHDVGDIVIRSVADIIDAAVGDQGVVGRYGGEEFIALLTMEDKNAYNLLEEIRINIEKNTINYGAGSVKLTISGGCSSFDNISEDSFDHAVIFADQALLEAKKTGRNKIIVYNEELHGSKAVDKLTGAYTKNALVYKHNQFHDTLRKSDVTYGMILIHLNTLIVNQFEILKQYVKQTASMLTGMLREKDVVGRYDDMTFVVLIDNVEDHIVRNIKERMITSSNKLSVKFDNLVETEIVEMLVSDWSIKPEAIYGKLFETLDKDID